MINQSSLSDTFVAGEALDADDQYVGVNIDSAGTSDTERQVEKCDAGEVSVGTYQGAVAAVGEAVSVVHTGSTKARAGAAVTVNAYLKTDANGKYVPTTTDTDNVVGQALTAASAEDEIFQMLILHGTFAG